MNELSAELEVHRAEPRTPRETPGLLTTGGRTYRLSFAGLPIPRVVGLVVINGFGWKPDGIAFRAMLASMGNPAVREIDAFTGWMTYASATRFGVARNWDRPTRRAYRRGFRRPQRRVFHRYMAAARRHD